MRIGLLGGTFNPIHRCHLFIASEVRSRLALDRVVFIPSGDPPHKAPTSLAPSRNRYEMIRLALDSDPGYSVSDIELQRTKKSYSIDTVRWLRDQYGPSSELFFIVGLDAFMEFPSWKEAEALLQLCNFTVVSRPGATFASLSELPLLPAVEKPLLDALDSGQRDRVDTALPQGRGLILLLVRPCEISSSEIRLRAKNRQSLSGLLPAVVESYIIQHGLFREDADLSRL